MVKQAFPAHVRPGCSSGAAESEGLPWLPADHKSDAGPPQCPAPAVGLTWVNQGRWGPDIPGQKWFRQNSSGLPVTRTPWCLKTAEASASSRLFASKAAVRFPDLGSKGFRRICDGVRCSEWTRRQLPRHDGASRLLCCVTPAHGGLHIIRHGRTGAFRTGCCLPRIPTCGCRGDT